MDSTRALLDELMGKDRNVPLSEKRSKSLRFTDSVVCKYELAGLCPFTLFKNTKSDLGTVTIPYASLELPLGTCQYELHKDNLDWGKVGPQWDQLPDREKLRYGYERELFRYLDTLVRDMDRKVARGKERAEKESAPRELLPEELVQLESVQEKVKDALNKAERMGEAGDVDQSMLYSRQAEQYKRQYDEMYKTFSTPERTMTVCEVCGVFINSTDNEQRRRDHLNGKQYQGWKSIREHRDRLAERMDLYRKLQEEDRQQQQQDTTEGETRVRERSRSAEGQTEEEKYHRDRSRSPRRRYPEDYKERYDDRRRYEDSYRRRSRYDDRRSRY